MFVSLGLLRVSLTTKLHVVVRARARYSAFADEQATHRLFLGLPGDRRRSRQIAKTSGAFPSERTTSRVTITICC